MKHAKWIPHILVLLIISLLFAVSFWLILLVDSQGFGIGVSAELLETRNCEFISDDSVTFTILNVGRKDVTIYSAYINGETATLEPNVSSKDGYRACTIPKDTSANFTVTLQDQTHFNSSETYEFKLFTQKGTMISNNATYNPT
jgi:hypothetical protein